MPISPSVLIDIVGATGSLLVVGSAGVYLSRAGLLNQEKISYLSKLIEELFTPCLIFSSFIKTLDITQVNEWLIPMIISLLSIFQGMFVGYLTNRYVLKDPVFEATIILGCGLAMTTNMQLNLSRSLEEQLNAISDDQGFNNPIQPLDRAIKYVMIFTFVNTIARWTFAKDIMVRLKEKQDKAFASRSKYTNIHFKNSFKDEDETQQKQESIQPQQEQQQQLSNSHQLQIPGQVTQGSHCIELQEVSKKPMHSNSLTAPLIMVSPPTSPNLQVNSAIGLQAQSHQLLQAPKHSYDIRTPPSTPKADEKEPVSESGCGKILKNHPIQAAIISVIVCMIPPLREALIQNGSFWNQTIFESSALIGGIILPLNLITLGGNLYLSTQRKAITDEDDERSRPISKKSLVGVTVVRLIIMPVVGAATIYVFNCFGLVDDPVLQFIVAVSYAVPSAINLLIISTLYFPKCAPEFAKVLLAGYVSNIFTLPIILIIFFQQFA